MRAKIACKIHGGRVGQPSEYRLTIYLYAIIVSFSKYRKNIDIAFFFENITRYYHNEGMHCELHLMCF